MSVFLVPASQENIDATIKRVVPFDAAKTYLSEEFFEVLRNAYSADATGFHCWAFAREARAISFFSKIEIGDIVLMSIRGTGGFSYACKVCFKGVLPELGRHLWPVVPGEPWDYIYFVSDILPVEIDKGEFMADLGYSPNGDLYYARPLQNAAKRLFTAKYLSEDNFWKSLQR